MSIGASLSPQKIHRALTVYGEYCEIVIFEGGVRLRQTNAKADQTVRYEWSGWPLLRVAVDST